MFALWNALCQVVQIREWNCAVPNPSCWSRLVSFSYLSKKSSRRRKKKGECKENQNYSFSVKQFNSREKAFHLNSKRVVPKLKLILQAKDLRQLWRRCTLRKLGEGVNWMLQRWPLITQLSRGPWPWGRGWRAARNTGAKVECAHWTAHIELLGGLTVLDIGSWL